jgi:hypothetical protein
MTGGRYIALSRLKFFFLNFHKKYFNLTGRETFLKTLYSPLKTKSHALQGDSTCILQQELQIGKTRQCLFS